MRLPSLAAALALGTVVWAGGSAASPTKTSTPTKSVRTTATVRKTSPATATTARKPATATSTAHKPAAKSAPVARTTWRNRQTAPTTDRYREIQEALVARGYLSADDANGAWGAASSEALKKFQVEQTLESTGRIDSLSLIALGLGPRHDSSMPRVVDANAQPDFGRNN